MNAQKSIHSIHPHQDVMDALDLTEQDLLCFAISNKDGGKLLKLLPAFSHREDLKQYNMYIIKNGIIVFYGFPYPNQVNEDITELVLIAPFKQKKHLSLKLQGVILAVDSNGKFWVPGNKINCDIKPESPAKGTDYYIYQNISLVLYADHTTEVKESLTKLYNIHVNDAGKKIFTFYTESMSVESANKYLQEGYCVISMDMDTGILEEFRPKKYIERLDYVSMTFNGKTGLTNNLYLSILNKVRPHCDEDKKIFRSHIHPCRSKDIGVLLDKYDSEYDNALAKVLAWDGKKIENDPQGMIFRILSRLTSPPVQQYKNFDNKIWVTNRYKREMPHNVLKLLDWAHGRLQPDILD